MTSSAPGRRVVVVGGGAAGVAAAYAAKSAGADVTVVMGRTGATSLTSGALDGTPANLASPLPIAGVARALGLWELAVGSDGSPRPCCVATSSGLLRPALGRDVNVLDLAEVSRGTVLVAGVPRPGWDAAGLARAWSAEPWAVSRGLRFEAAPLDVLRLAGERSMPDADLALSHDDPQRAAWLAERLEASVDVQRAAALLLGPWLGIRRPLARELGRALGKPVGEPLSLPGGAAGLRFEHARDDFLARHHIARREGELSRAERPADAIELAFTDGSALDADAVVLATGGLAGGGIGWRGGEDRFLEQPGPAGASFVGSAHTPAAIALGDAPLGISGSPQGPLFEAYAWTGGHARAPMESVGIWTASDGRARAADGQAIPWLYCAGDAVAGAPRTLLYALRSGLAAGLAAAR